MWWIKEAKGGTKKLRKMRERTEKNDVGRCLDKTLKRNKSMMHQGQFYEKN